MSDPPSVGQNKTWIDVPLVSEHDLIEAAPNYGAEGCLCGNFATPYKECPLHWALWLVERKQAMEHSRVVPEPGCAYIVTPQMKRLADEHARLEEDLAALREQMANMVPATWDGLIQLLDTWYPESVFTGRSEDVGVKVVVLARELAALREAAQAVADASVPVAEVDLAPHWRRLVDVLARTEEEKG